MNPLDNLTRDVSLALALLLDNQDKWQPEGVFHATVTTSDGKASLKGPETVPLTLIPWVRS